MAMKASPLKGMERDNHKYSSREWDAGKSKWKYTYTEPKEKGVYRGKTASWVTNYNKLKSKVIGAPASESSGSTSVSKALANSKRVSAGRTAASKLVKTKPEENVEPVVRAKTTSIDFSDRKYKESTEKLQKDLETNKSNTEKYYKEQFEAEKNSYRGKLMNALSERYGNDIPNDRVKKVDSQVEEYTKSLWDDVYKPMVDRVNKANEANTDTLLKTLKKLYEK